MSKSRLIANLASSSRDAYFQNDVGIGTTLPTSTLTVSGDSLITGIITATTFSGTLSGNISGYAGTYWTSNNDGSGSGLDADLLDGQQGSYYLDYNNFTNTPAASTANNGTLTLSVSGTGLSGSATFTANQSENSTFTVTSNATSANTGSTIVARDASGNFSAGTITATLSGNASGITGYSGTYWTSNNDGSGSGLDADTVDGIQASSFARNDTYNSVNAGFQVFRNIGSSDGSWPDADHTLSLENNDAGTIVLNFHRGGYTSNNLNYNGSRFRFDSNLDVSGNISATGNVTGYSSDERLKENFVHIEDPIEKVLNLNGYTFDWNEKSKELGFTPKHETNDIGLIAQEVEKVLPQAVDLAPFDSDYKDGKKVSKSGENYLTIQYERLVPLLVEAIKKQQEQIEGQQKQINELKKELRMK